MKLPVLALLGAAIMVAGALSGSDNTTSSDLTQHVNLFIGTNGPAPHNSYDGGNIFPGPSMPFGAVKPGIDTTE